MVISLRAVYIVLLSCIVVQTSVQAKSKGLHEYGYPAQYRNIAHNEHKPVGILVTAYNRPRYFRKLVASLSKNPEAEHMPFFFILDGGPQATQQENMQIILKSPIKHKYIIARNSNYGNGKTIIDARRFMFEWCGFEKILVFEDDLVVSSNYIKFTLNLHKWARENFDNIGVVTGMSVCHLSLDQKRARLRAVKEGWDGYWGYCIDKEVYYKIKPMIEEYERKCLIEVPRNKLNGQAVAQWFMTHLRHYTPIRHRRTFKSTIDYLSRFKAWIYHVQHLQKRRDGQDIETRFALFKAGYIKIHTEVNRARYIGKHGVHNTSDRWKEKGFEEVILHAIAEDATLTHFHG